jgi:hypothetical protein
MASIRKRTKKDGSTSFMVCWRDPVNRSEQGITLPTESEAITLKRLLDANNQSFEIAQHAMLANQTNAPTVAAVIQEHIDLLVQRVEPCGRYAIASNSLEYGYGVF